MKRDMLGCSLWLKSFITAFSMKDYSVGALVSGRPELKALFYPYEFCDAGRVTQCFRASVSSSSKWAAMISRQVCSLGWGKSENGSRPSRGRDSLSGLRMGGKNSSNLTVKESVVSRARVVDTRPPLTHSNAQGRHH